MPDGTEQSVLCKYGDRISAVHGSYGHRRGVPYEAMVYERLLRPAGAQVPPWWGAYVDQQQRTWLVIGFLEGGLKLSRAEPGQVHPLSMAARWIAQFQNAVDAPDLAPVRASLITYDGAYYAGWALRTLEFAHDLDTIKAWLAPVVDRYVQSIVPMLLAHSTVAHGEFYPANLLWWRGAVYVLDWESTAVGAPEIDLACLLEGWPAPAASDALEVYRRERIRPKEARDLGTALDAAGLYQQFRWLGDEREWRVDDPQWRFDLVRDLARRLGIL
jgi:aminoglycoside phosphotransferase (APT) family kinase protein